jgi:hypothetical protein
MVIHGELQKDVEIVMTYLKILSYYLPEENEKNYKKVHSR